MALPALEANKMSDDKANNQAVPSGEWVRLEFDSEKYEESEDRGERLTAPEDGLYTIGHGKMVKESGPTEYPPLPDFTFPSMSAEERALRRERFDKIAEAVRAFDPDFEAGAYRYSELIEEAIKMLTAERERIKQ